MKVPYMGNMRFVRSGEVWKFAPDMVGNEANAPVFARIEPHIPEFEPVIADIRAGKYATIHDLRIKLNRMATAINNEALPPLDLPARPKVLRPSTRPTETIAASFWAHATGDAAAALACWKDRTPEQIASIRQSAKNAKIGANLFDAISANFGRREATNTMLMLGLELGLTGTLLEKAPVTENGDTAHVDLRPSGIDHADLVKQNGVWLLATRHDKLPPAAWGERIDTYYFPAYAQLARDIDAGKFETAGEVQRIVKKLNGEMQTEYKKMAATTKKAQ
jgi:hypothetical protein